MLENDLGVPSFFTFDIVSIMHTNIYTEVNSEAYNVLTEVESSTHDAPETDAVEERRKNLEILQSIVGSKSVSLHHPTSAKTKTKKLADTPSTVFRLV